MKIAVALSAAFYATGALGAVGTAARRARYEAKLAARANGNSRLSYPRLPAIDSDGSIAAAEIDPEGNVTHPEYSSNWAGAVLIGSGYTKVVGTIVVPTPKKPTGGSSSTTYYASAWVGIDGDTCGNAILQTGVDFVVKGTTVSYELWYEWFPDYAYDFSGVSVKAGDSLRMTVTASSKSGGTALIENLTTGGRVSHTFSAQSAALCEQNAEWIVEDFSSGNSLVPFANFGTVTFTGASTNLGGVTGATIIDIKQNNKVLTDCSTSGSSTVSCTYTG